MNKLLGRSDMSGAPKVRTSSDGFPFYCKTCGVGFVEYLGCELEGCLLETSAEARARRASRLFERAVNEPEPGRSERLCEDEGCPHADTPHVCHNRAALERGRASSEGGDGEREEGPPAPSEGLSFVPFGGGPEAEVGPVRISRNGEAYLIRQPDEKGDGFLELTFNEVIEIYQWVVENSPQTLHITVNLII